MSRYRKILKNRREFIKDGVRALVFGGLALTGVFLGWRGYSRPGKEPTCPMDLPCRKCSKLPGCQEPRAIDAKQTPHETRFQSLKRNKGFRDDR